jgi:dTDP-4-dehydrorhamnose 3,5-epimerase
MIIKKTFIEDLVIVNPTIFEVYNQAKFNEKGINDQFIQDNHSSCKRRIVRELYLQINPLTQEKPASVLDAEVDLGKKLPIYEQFFNVVLIAENKKQYLYEN